MPPDRRRHGNGRRARRGHRRVPGHLRRRGGRARLPAGPAAQPPAQRHHGNRRGHGDQHAHAQPGGGLRGDCAHDEPAAAEAHHRRDAGGTPGTRLPERRHRRGRRNPRGLRHRSGNDPHTGPCARGGRRSGPSGNRGDRAPVPRRTGAGDRQAEGAVRVGSGDGNHRLQEPLGPPHRATHPGDGEARPQPAGRPRRALPTDAPGGDVRNQQRRAGGRRAPHARHPRDVPPLHRPPPGRRGAPATGWPGPRNDSTWSLASSRRWTP